MEPFQNDGKEQDKPVIGFKERIKSLICNMTNYDAISDIAGTDETRKWPGVEVELFADEVRFRGKLVDSVRVRKPPQAQLQAIGNGEPVAPRSRPAAASQPAPRQRPVCNDLSDDIPWMD
jgi:hypothetical protein